MRGKAFKSRLKIESQNIPVMGSLRDYQSNAKSLQRGKPKLEKVKGPTLRLKLFDSNFPLLELGENYGIHLPAKDSRNPDFSWS